MSDNATEPGGPALTFRSKLYPAAFRDRVPKTVRTPRPVYADFGFIDRAQGLEPLATVPEGVYPAWTNSHGAVSAVFSDGRALGLKPGEFEVVEWYDKEAVR